jgi:hypothetical protein
VPDGRAANQAFGGHLQATDGRAVAGRGRELGGDRLAGQLGRGDLLGRQLAQHRLLLAVAGASTRA